MGRSRASIFRQSRWHLGNTHTKQIGLFRINYLGRIDDNYPADFNKKNRLFIYALFFSIAFSFDFNKGGMMDNTVDSSRRHHGIRKDMIPLAERLI
jgi:hypothetical protein